MTIILIRSVIIYLLVVLSVRIMGKRQIGELNPHEFVITILISSVATIPIEESSIPLSYSIVPILIFVSLEVIESALCVKFPAFDKLIDGQPIFVIKNGKLRRQELKRLRFSLDDLNDALRQKDVFDINEVENAIVETNGSLSVQKKKGK
ncbi:MAG: DUF421 domain-containing protein [Ruminococcaceae bacterium]|nr:DUF421 domain-containing protein [Oscillospiraceae bacterium]